MYFSLANVIEKDAVDRVETFFKQTNIDFQAKKPKNKYKHVTSFIQTVALENKPG